MQPASCDQVVLLFDTAGRMHWSLTHEELAKRGLRPSHRRRRARQAIPCHDRRSPGRGHVMIVTPFYAGLLALLFLLLSVRVSQRRQTGITLGDGGDARLLRVIRGHANFAEYVPIILVMMVMLEIDHT